MMSVHASRVFGVVGGDHDDRVVAGDTGEGFADRGRSVHVELGGGLVHEHERGLGRERAGEHEALGLSAGQFREPAVGDPGQVEPVHERARLFLGLAAREPLGEQGQADVVDRGALGHAVRVLENPAHRVDSLPGHIGLRRAWSSRR